MVTHTYTHTYTHDNYSKPRCAHAHRGLIIIIIMFPGPGPVYRKVSNKGGTPKVAPSYVTIVFPVLIVRQYGIQNYF